MVQFSECIWRELVSKKTFVYTGCENLEAMTEAKNYNRYLIGLVEEALGGTKGKKILDFGAGSGTYADMLKEKGIQVDCLEPDKKLQKILTKKGYKVLSDAKELKAGSYDLIYALNVFEHIENDHDNFALLSKAIKKDGAVLIYVPAFQSLFSSMDNLVGHHRRYRKSRLNRMAQESDMKVAKLQYCDPVGFLATLAFKATRNKKGVISPKSVKLYDRVAFPVSRALEPLFKNLAGKNVVLIAKKYNKT